MLIFKEEDFSSEDHYSDDIDAPASSQPKRFKSKLIIPFLAIALTAGYTMAGNITLGNNSPIESGQGVALYAACSGATQITLRPAVTFVNGNPGAFKFSSFDVSNVPVGCHGTDFQFSAYGDTGTALALYDSNGTSVNVYNNAGTFEANSLSGYTVSNLATGSFRVTFDSPAALSASIYKFTLQSGIHVAYASVNSWLISAGTTSSGQYIYDSAIDSSGNTYSLSYSAEMRINGTTYNPGSVSAWITKSNTSGTFLWTKNLSSSGVTTGNSIALDSSGNIYVGGRFNGTLTVGSSTLTAVGSDDGFIAKLDSSGNGIWAAQISGTNMDNVLGVAVDSSNNPLVTGYTTSSSLSIAGQTFTRVSSQDVFVAKYNSSGASVWAIQGSSSPTDQNQSIDIVADSSNNVYVAGYHSGTFTLGSTTKSGNGSNDAFIAKINAGGSIQWIANPGSSSSEYLGSINVDSSGNVYAAIEFTASFTVAGTTISSAGSNDVAVVKFNSSGVAQWVRTFGGTGYDAADMITLDGAGNIWVTGKYQNTLSAGSYSVTSSFGYDNYVVRLNTSGIPDFIKSIGSSNTNDVPGGVQIFNSYLYFVGEYAGSLTFEGSTISSGSSSDRDIFIAAFKYQ